MSWIAAGKSIASGPLGQPIADEEPPATRDTSAKAHRQRDSRRGTGANLKELEKSTVAQRVANFVTPI